jgi:plastocyanin
MKAPSKRRGLGTGVVFIATMVFVVLLAGIAYYASTGNAASSQSHQMMPQTTVAATTTTSLTSTTSSGASAQLEEVHVSMPYGVGTTLSSNFEPSTIDLVIGINNTVVWTNNDSAPHVVSATSVPSGATKFDSGNMMPGATFSYTFKVPGTYKYACTYHYWMQGTIEVSQAA